MARSAALWSAALLADMLAAPPTKAQTERPRVDPPAAPDRPTQVPPDPVGPGVAPQPSPSDTTPPSVPAQPDDAAGTAPPSRPAEVPATAPPPARLDRPPGDPAAPDTVAKGPRTPEERPPPEGISTQLAIEYLDFWSAPNPVTLEALPSFYAPRVEFHGRMTSARALFDQKRRFVQRWPVRSYTHRPETLQTTCNPSSEICTVRTVFDFVAVSPERGRCSEGTGNLELEISVAGDMPEIVAETSRVVRRGRAAARTALEDVDEE